mgnify:CR=1 FL=1
MLVYSACLASCAIPGVYQPVELLAKERDGSTVPYFKQGWLWTDGGLQAHTYNIYTCRYYIYGVAVDQGWAAELQMYVLNIQHIRRSVRLNMHLSMYDLNICMSAYIYVYVCIAAGGPPTTRGTCICVCKCICVYM